MNVFILDNDLAVSAQYLCDKHLGKQILEIAQILCSVLHIKLQQQYDIGSNRCVEDQEMFHEEFSKIPYKPTHINHPVVKWALEDRNFNFLHSYSFYLGHEYRHRFDKSHKSLNVIFSLNLQSALPPTLPNDFPIKNDLEYYKDKLYMWLCAGKIAKWTNRNLPEWYRSLLLNSAVEDAQKRGLYDL